MRRGEHLPDLPLAGALLLALLLLVAWLGARIRLLRRRQDRIGPGDGEVPAREWLRALAARPWILPLLGGVAALLGLGILLLLV